MEILKEIKQSLKSSIAFPCSYIEGNLERRIYIDLKKFKNKTKIISELSSNGFRRSYDHMYIPQCEECKLCIPSRINLKKFILTKSTKRNLKKNKDILLKINTENIEAMRFKLFKEYCIKRHQNGQMKLMSFDEFNNFFHKNLNDTLIVDLFNSRQFLVGSILLDKLVDGYSAVYSFFDPNLKSRGLGKYMILRSLELLREKNRDYLYLGYWVKNSSSMNYKADFKGIELFYDGSWMSN